ncbi:addiction module toxin, RelE/StbE family [Spirochaetia bacterium]|nr:addiction module toxin, RelE/StbE family [Spirochaetia bacterium]
MLKHTFAGSFKNDLKMLEKRRWDTTKLRDVMDLIIAEQLLPPRCRNHPLHGEWEGSLDCHVQGDWVLIYEIDPAAKTVTFHRTGTHSDLFKK